jgi:hypothetical protein
MIAQTLLRFSTDLFKNFALLVFSQLNTALPSPGDPCEPPLPWPWKHGGEQSWSVITAAPFGSNEVGTVTTVERATLIPAPLLPYISMMALESLVAKPLGLHGGGHVTPVAEMSRWWNKKCVAGSLAQRLGLCEAIA